MTNIPSTSEFVTGETEMVEMETEKCRRLLRSHTVGRVAFRDDRGLTLFPVNYASDGHHIAIRCDRDSRLNRASESEVVFEIDDLSPQTRSGWSVVVSGVAYEINDAHDHESELIRALPVDTWAPGRKGCWMRIEPRTISGRVVRPA